MYFEEQFAVHTQIHEMQNFPVLDLLDQLLVESKLVDPFLSILFLNNNDIVVPVFEKNN